MTQISAVIYDMDGLLIDSEPYWRKAEMAVFASVGLQLTEQDCIDTTGFRFDEVIDFWYSRHPWQGKTKAQIEDEVLTIMEHAILYQAKLLDGVEESLDFFVRKGLPLAIASSSAMRLIRACVQRLHRENLFHQLVSAEGEAYGKPHPAVFLRAAEALGVAPQNCLVLEDSLNGVIAAKAAKMTCIAIPQALDKNNPKFAIADHLFHSLRQVQELDILQ